MGVYRYRRCSNFSSRAKNKKDVGSATVIGLISVLIIYFLLTVLAQGVILQNHISQLDSPSMAQVLATIVGGWGSTLVNIGLIISVLGAWLGWTLLAGELPFIVAKDGLFPKWFAKENKNGAPVKCTAYYQYISTIIFNKYAIYTECVSICIFTSIKCYFIPLHVQCILPS